MFENFLYYTNDACMNTFTQGQVDRMHVIIENSPRRFSLLNSIGTSYPDEKIVSLGIQDVITPGKAECDGEFTSRVRLRNTGTEGIAEFDLIYELDSKVQTYSYSGDTIRSGESLEIELYSENLAEGSYRLDLELTNVPGNSSKNKRVVQVFAVDGQSDFIPLREQFEIENLESSKWISINEDGDIGWKLSEAKQSVGSNMAAFMNFYNYESQGEFDWLVSPILDFSSASYASLKFKTSYAKNANFNDMMYVMLMENCSGNFDNVIRVLDANDLAVDNSGDFWEPAGQEDWITHTLDLNDWAGLEEVRIAFRTINGYGNNLFLDDIEFFTTDSKRLVSTAQNSYTLYPNPAFNGQFELAFNTKSRQTITVRIIDQLGHLIQENELPNTLNQTYTYDLSDRGNGVYIVQAVGEDFLRIKKVVIHK